MLVEDHQMFREWLAQMIAKDRGFTICGEADNIQSAMKIIQAQRPDIAIIDISLRGSSGLELIKDLKAHDLEVPVLVLSMHEETLYAERVLRAGRRLHHQARGLVTLLKAIRQVLDGKVYLSEKMTPPCWPR